MVHLHFFLQKYTSPQPASVLPSCFIPNSKQIHPAIAFNAMKVDFIIVAKGLAGTLLAFELFEAEQIVYRF